jgi:hypothetical protein
MKNNAPNLDKTFNIAKYPLFSTFWSKPQVKSHLKKAHDSLYLKGTITMRYDHHMNNSTEVKHINPLLPDLPHHPGMTHPILLSALRETLTNYRHIDAKD